MEEALPLEGCEDGDPLDGGYGFGEWTGKDWHPGRDLNAGDGGDSDLGRPVRAKTRGRVAFVGQWDGHTTGEGNHVWIEAHNGRGWVHHDHLSEVWVVVGQTVGRDTIIGLCGKTGGWRWAHDHVEVTRGVPATWTQWVRGWTLSRVLATYYDPADWFAQEAQLAELERDESLITPEQYSDEQIQAYMQQLGGVFPLVDAEGNVPGLTARALLAYRREEGRGPVMPWQRDDGTSITGEYDALALDGSGNPTIPARRLRFTAGILEWRSDTNACYWVEVCAHPEALTAG